MTFVALLPLIASTFAVLGCGLGCRQMARAFPYDLMTLRSVFQDGKRDSKGHAADFARPEEFKKVATLLVAEGDAWLAPLLNDVATARSREGAIAILNEHLSDVESWLAAGARTPGTMSRVSVAVGLLFVFVSAAQKDVTWVAAAQSLAAAAWGGLGCATVGRHRDRATFQLRREIDDFVGVILRVIDASGLDRANRTV